MAEVAWHGFGLEFQLMTSVAVWSRPIIMGPHMVQISDILGPHKA